MTDKIRVQDDLYAFVNQEWIDKAVIPDDKPRVGGFADLDEQVEKLMIEEFNKMSAGELDIPDENMKKAIKLFDIAKNIKKRNRDGIKPVLKELKKIQSLRDIKDFNRKLKDLTLNRYPMPFDIGVMVDMKDTMHNAIMFGGPSQILPDTTYYKEEMKAQHDALIGIWSKMVSALLKLTPLSEDEQAQYVNGALQFDAVIASLVKSNEEWAEYTKVYNPTKVGRVATLVKPVTFKRYLKNIFGENLPQNIIVTDPRFLKGFATLFNEETFANYKCWAYITHLLHATSYLSEQIRELGSTYQRALSGVAALPTIQKQAYHLASSAYSEPIGLYYGRKYFGEEAKHDVVEMVQEIIETYKKRVANNDILSSQTKEKAIIKLDKIGIKMGYPDKCEEIYDKLVFDDNATLYGALSSISKIKRLDNFESLQRPVNRDEWAMPGHMVNACYSPFTNDITFPAAILQAPFYSIKQSRSENLGGIGAVIGHEISHAFDNNGSHCDENGNLNNWWTKEDQKKFNARTKAMIREFDGIDLGYGKVNGSFIVSENIADNGGMAVTLDIMSHMADADYEGYFYNWARVWCMKARPEFLQLLLSVDVHGPAVLRANMQPRNFQEWYDTFQVKKTDKMYIAPNKRVVIW